MNILYLILLLVGAVCFAGAASQRIATRVDLIAAGLFFWILVPLIQTIDAL